MQIENLNVKEKYLKMVVDLLAYFCPESIVLAYGSRVGGDSHPGSDLDLAINNFSSDKGTVGTLKGLFDESNIPFYVDIHKYEDLPLSFQKEIDRNNVQIYPR